MWERQPTGEVYWQPHLNKYFLAWFGEWLSLGWTDQPEREMMSVSSIFSTYFPPPLKPNVFPDGKAWAWACWVKSIETSCWRMSSWFSRILTVTCECPCMWALFLVTITGQRNAACGDLNFCTQNKPTKDIPNFCQILLIQTRPGYLSELGLFLLIYFYLTLPPAITGCFCHKHAFPPIRHLWGNNVKRTVEWPRKCIWKRLTQPNTFRFKLLSHTTGHTRAYFWLLRKAMCRSNLKQLVNWGFSFGYRSVLGLYPVYCKSLIYGEYQILRGHKKKKRRESFWVCIGKI